VWSARSRSTCCATRSARRSRAARPARRHRRQDGDGARRSVRIGDVGVIAASRRAAERPGRLALDGQPARAATSPTRPRASSPRPGGRPGTSPPSPSPRRRSPSAALGRPAYTLRPDVAIVVDVTFATDAPGRARRSSARTSSARARASRAARRSTPTVSNGSTTRGEAEGIPFTVSASRGDGDGRRRGPPLARRRPHRGGLRAAALDALAGRDGPARRRRRMRAADRRGSRCAAPPT
jgi:endoglucanase